MRLTDDEHTVKESISLKNSGRKQAVVSFIAETIPSWVVIDPMIVVVPSGSRIPITVRVKPLEVRELLLMINAGFC